MPSGGPRRINWLTLLMLLGLGAGGYWVWKFFPVYWEGYQVDQILAEGAARAYKISRFTEPQRTRSVQELVDGMQAKIVALGVRDPSLRVHLQYLGNDVVTSCDYSVVVQHALVSKQTVVVMHRQKKADLKRTNWD